MTLRHSLIGLVLASACAPALAAQVDFSAINDATTSAAPRFIVKYKVGSAPRTQATPRQQSLTAAATRAQPMIHVTTDKSGKQVGLRMATVRATANGMHVVRASQRLTRAEAEALMKSLAADANVEYVAVDSRVHVDVLPNDPMLATNQIWHYGTGNGGARVTTAWDLGARGTGVVVAVVDTGATHHPDLEPNLLPGYDMISDLQVSGRTTDDRVPGGWDLGDWTTANQCGTGSSARNSTWHGTHVSGTIAEVTNNATGGAGIAPDARIVPVRVLGHCGGYTSDVADGIIWAAGGNVPGVPVNPNPAEVINMSLGGAETCPQITQDAINIAVSLGATVVVAAGNDNMDAGTHSPASCANVVTVGASGYAGQRASYSNYGPKVDIAAPGGAGVEGSPNGYIWSTLNAGTTVPAAFNYAGYTGTSMATPHVAGIVALMQSMAAKPLTPAQVEGLLVASARPFPLKTDRPIGAGIVDAAAAVQRAQSFGLPVVGRPLTSGIADTVPPLAAGQSVIYQIDVPANAKSLEMLSFGGRGTVRLYAQYEAEPMPTGNLASSVRPGTNQSIVLNAPVAGRYFVKVTAAADMAGVSMRATVR